MLERAVPDWTVADFAAALENLEQKFSLAIFAAANLNTTPTRSPARLSGRDIFWYTLGSINLYLTTRNPVPGNTLIRHPSEAHTGQLPRLVNTDLTAQDSTLVPYIVLVALANHLFPSPEAEPWPSSLQSLPNQIRFFTDATRLFIKGFAIHPVISNIRGRTHQLLSTGRELIQEEIRHLS